MLHAFMHSSLPGVLQRIQHSSHGRAFALQVHDHRSGTVKGQINFVLAGGRVVNVFFHFQQSVQIVFRDFGLQTRFGLTGEFGQFRHLGNENNMVVRPR